VEREINMAIDFYSAKSHRDMEKGKMTGHAVLEDGLQDFLLKFEDEIDLDANCILELDSYGDLLLGKSSIQELMVVCGGLKQHKVLKNYKRYDLAFHSLIELEKLCQLALENDEYIWVCGD